MTSSAAQFVKVVDDVSTVKSFLDSIDPIQGNKPQELFMDLEGVNLSRNGSISVLSIYVPEQQRTYLIDVHRLGHIAFIAYNSHCTSLKVVLEDRGQLKVIFDVRNDSDALFSHFGVSLRGVRDLQLMELACRQGPRTFVSGLAKCVENDSGLLSVEAALWREQKERGMRLFDPKRGGRYEVFNDRPMKAEIAEYCAQDVVVMKRLYDVYLRRLDGFWFEMVEELTLARIAESKQLGYDSHSHEKARGPWSEAYVTRAKKHWEEKEQERLDWEDWEDNNRCLGSSDCFGWVDYTSE